MYTAGVSLLPTCQNPSVRGRRSFQPQQQTCSTWLGARAAGGHVQNVESCSQFAFRQLFARILHRPLRHPSRCLLLAFWPVPHLFLLGLKVRGQRLIKPGGRGTMYMGNRLMLTNKVKSYSTCIMLESFVSGDRIY